ncbi:molybdopterin molybdochelatase [Arboricoccus pini]|uniref:Molybdopterin molybdenumtransferase n=1 Tax=Arboricoccus pini TaxID=1963835 RepID=A0A212QP39_9PROT|nr:gephyrin-like molybdotransferase Glp [Arboricoccus pini]SNB61190.1 molybdopterin molybdochelatase [Arboricoccus pini]
MLAVTEARQRIVSRLTTVSGEWVPLDLGLDRVLAGDLVARRTQPPGAVSAMDGYAVRAAEIVPGQWLNIAGENRAGHQAVEALPSNAVARIFTGALLPEDADAVMLQENADRDGDRVRFSEAARTAQFVRPRGLDFTEGWKGLLAGTLLGPRQLGLAAAMGHAILPVRRRPRIAILATGDEVKRPGEFLRQGDVLSSNATTLAALLRRWGAEPVDLGVAADDEQDLDRAVAQAERCDMLVTSGGASVGEHDLVSSSLTRRGLELDFWKIAMRPGKPMMFGRLGDCSVLGLPGNPVSATVCATLFLRAAVRRLLGQDTALPETKAIAATPLPANDQREDYLRARFVGIDPATGLPLVQVAERQDSSMFAVLSQADCLIIRPAFAEPAPQGTSVTIVNLRAAGV